MQYGGFAGIAMPGRHWAWHIQALEAARTFHTTKKRPYATFSQQLFAGQ